MRLITEDALLSCNHLLGVVRQHVTQDLLLIDGRRVLVEHDPQGCAIVGCPNIGATIKPCTLTVKVETGYSAFVRVDGRPVCLDTITGLTDGTPPATVKFSVRAPGQAFVQGDA